MIDDAEMLIILALDESIGRLATSLDQRFIAGLHFRSACLFS